MKKLKGVHKFKSYQEMCAALDIVPAKRGEDKESQLKEIRMFYVVDINKSGRIILTRINRKKEQARLDLESGKIKEVYGEQINLKSPKCYSHTGIDQYLLFCALNNNTQTKQGFVIHCFRQCKYFKTVLKRENEDLRQKLTEQYSVDVLVKADEIIMVRLETIINTALRRFEEKGYISCERHYLLSDDTQAELSEIQPIVEAALKEMNLKSEYQAFANKELREKFIQLRKEKYQEKYATSVYIKRKELIITPLIDKRNPWYPQLTKRDRQNILTHFFAVFREKLFYEIRTNPKISQLNTRKGILPANVDKKLTEIVQEYCVYMTTSNKTKEEKAFYSPKDIDETEDDIRPYFEDDPEDKKEYDYFAVSNLR